jgi:hypothetical protein
MAAMANARDIAKKSGMLAAIIDRRRSPQKIRRPKQPEFGPVYHIANTIFEGLLMRRPLIQTAICAQSMALAC